MIVVPQAFITSVGVEKVLIDGTDCIILKEADIVNPDEERYVSTHALTLVLSGQLSVASLDGPRQIIGENQMVFLPKGLYMISDIIPQHSPFEAIVFFFSENTIDDFIKSACREVDDERKVDSNRVFSYSNELKIFVDSLISLYGKAHDNHQVTKLKLIELLNLISRSEEGQRLISIIRSLKNIPKGNVRNFMERNFDRGLKIEDYAYLTGRSISTFCRDFKRQFGTAPKRWLISKRMERAKSLLESENINVTQLAFESGYENVSHFIKAFQKEFGISPKQFQIKKREAVMR